MAFAKKLLAVLIAAALSLAPVGSAMARFNGPNVGAVASAATHGDARVPDNGGAHAPDYRPTIGSVHHSDVSTSETAHSGSIPCDHAKTSKQDSLASHGDCDCCGKQQNACAEFCLHKCFGQLCAMTPDRLAAFSGSDRFRLPPGERPPDWIVAPRTPPPRA